jgi:predicted DNA-binding protein
MAVSVRLDPLMEKELELSAKQQGITKSQFIIAALERALGRKNPYALMMQAKADAALEAGAQQLADAYVSEAIKPYDTARSRQDLIAKLRVKHGLSAH